MSLFPRRSPGREIGGPIVLLLSCRRCESNGCIVIVASFLSYFGCVEIAVLIVAPRADLADATPALVESIHEF